MSLSEKDSSEETEALVDSLTIESTSLNEGNLHGLSTTDLQTLTELSQELTLNNNETDETEVHEMMVESQAVIEHEEEVETEEMSCTMDEEMEHSQIIAEELVTETKLKASSLPPLRPLTIAPKPAKIPVTVKPATGQQLFLLQGGGAGQTIKLLSPQGQELNVANFISRPITLKPTFKTVTSQSANISIIQQKPVVMKKILAPGQKTVSKPITSLSPPNQHFMVLQKADQQGIKLIQAPTNVAVAGSTTKTITLQQAQEMGLVVNKTKLISQAQTVPKQTVLLKNPTTKTVKFVPQVTPQLVTSVSGNVKNVAFNAVKSPTKILPAGAVSVNKAQRIIFKTAAPNQTILPAGQLIQVSGTQALNTGQLHQINIPGKGMQYIKFVTTSPTEQNAAAVSPGAVVKTSSVASGSNIVFSEIKPLTVVSKIAPKPTKPTVVTANKSISTTQMLMIPTITTTLAPANKIPLAPANKVAIPPTQPNPSKLAASLKAALSQNESSPTIVPKEEPDANGIRPRKPCNCTKSQCLKLYCDCFANGEFCYMCNCMNCFNNLENEEHRNRAIKACLERNPHAFRPKIGKAKDITGDVAIRKHTKGCNCKRSGCLKNYCECYEAKIACSNNCKCIGCRNIEDCIEKKNIRHITSTEKATNTPTIATNKIIPSRDRLDRTRRSSNSRKQTINFITDDVIEATCQCLLTISDNADEELQDEETIKRLIIEEFGRCLTEIIDYSTSRHLS